MALQEKLLNILNLFNINLSKEFRKIKKNSHNEYGTHREIIPWTKLPAPQRLLDRCLVALEEKPPTSQTIFFQFLKTILLVPFLSLLNIAPKNNNMSITELKLFYLINLIFSRLINKFQKLPKYKRLNN